MIAAFASRFVKTGRAPAELHRYLLRAQEARHVADYDQIDGATAEEAREHIERAREFIEFAERVLTE